MEHKYDYNWTLKDAVFTKDKGKVFSCFACGGGSTMGYKLAGFDVTDRITVGYKANLELQAAIEKHNAAISTEVLAISFINQVQDASPATATDDELGLQVWLTKA